MGGSSKKTDSTAAATQVGTSPAMLSFQSPAGNLVADQLAGGGLLGSVTNPGLLYSAMNVPILDTPAQLRQYMLNKGMGYLDAEGKQVAAPVAASASPLAAIVSGTTSPAAAAKTTKASDYRFGGR